MAQNTDVRNFALAAVGQTSRIAATATAEETIPTALSPLISLDDLGRVQELTVSNLGWFDAAKEYHPCTACPKTLVMSVDVALKWSDTKVDFVRTNGMQITVDRGIITVTKVPNGDPTKIYTACASNTCSSVRIKGMNIATLTKRAIQLGYGQTGGGRRDAKWDRAHGKMTRLHGPDYYTKFGGDGHRRMGRTVPIDQDEAEEEEEGGASLAVGGSGSSGATGGTRRNVLCDIIFGLCPIDACKKKAAPDDGSPEASIQNALSQHEGTYGNDHSKKNSKGEENMGINIGALRV